MTTHDVTVPADEYAEILSGARTHVFVDSDDVLVGDSIRAIEIADGIGFTGREVFGAVHSVSRGSKPGLSVVSVRWAFSQRRISQLESVILAAVIHGDPIPNHILRLSDASMESLLQKMKKRGLIRFVDGKAVATDVGREAFNRFFGG